MAPIGEPIKRPVILDAANIAFSYGGRNQDARFNTRAILLACEHFMQSDHDVFIVLQQNRADGVNREAMQQEDVELMTRMVNALFSLGVAIKVPQNQRAGDDEFVLSIANSRHGFAVSWDNFRPQIAKQPLWKPFVDIRAIEVTFSGDDSVFTRWPGPESIISVCNHGEEGYGAIKEKRFSAEKRERAKQAVHQLLHRTECVSSPTPSGSQRLVNLFPQHQPAANLRASSSNPPHCPIIALVILSGSGLTYLWHSEHKVLTCTATSVGYAASPTKSYQVWLVPGTWVTVELQGKEVVQVDKAIGPQNVSIAIVGGELIVSGRASVLNTNARHGSLLRIEAIGPIRLKGDQLAKDSQLHCNRVWLDKAFKADPKKFCTHPNPNPWVTTAEFVSGEMGGAVAGTKCMSQPRPSHTGSTVRPQTQAVVIRITPETTFLWSKLEKLLLCYKTEAVKGSQRLTLGEWVEAEFRGQQVLHLYAVQRPADVKITVVNGQVRAKGEAGVLHATAQNAMLFNEAIGAIRLKEQDLQKGDRVQFEAWIDPKFFGHPKANAAEARPWITNAERVKPVSESESKCTIS